MERYFHHPVLGTNLTVGIELPPRGDGSTPDPDIADELDRVIVAEISRLEAIFTIFDDDSELQRWKQRRLDHPSPEFVEVMGEARDWVTKSAGAFHPLAGEFSAIWRAQAGIGNPPRPEMLAAVVERLVEPGFDVVDGRPVATGDVSAFQLHAFAKGWIIDRGLERAIGYAAAALDDPDSVEIVINAGGDLAHRGPKPTTIGIENPLRPFDNEPPVDRVRLHNAGLATSGRARQGVEVGGRHYSHVIDPRTGWPVDHHASITVVAPTAATADVIATIAGVEPPASALAVATRYGVACAVVTNEGALEVNPAWAALRVPTSAG